MSKRLKKILSIFALSALSITSSVFAQEQTNFESFESVEELTISLKTLDKEQLIKTINDLALKLEQENGSISEMSIFNNVMIEHLQQQLTSEDYANIIRGNEYSDYFKTYMMDMYQYNQEINETSNEKEFNDTLRDILSSSTSNTLKQAALQSIDDLTTADIPMLQSILDSSDSDEGLRTKCIFKIFDLDSSQITEYLHDILNLGDQSTAKEIGISGKLLLRNSINPEQVASQLGEIIQDTNDYDTLCQAVYSLGDYADPLSVHIIANNIDKIDDNSLIRYFSNKNFNTISSMLSPTALIEDISAALICVEYSMVDDFKNNLEELITHDDEYISTAATELLMSMSVKGSTTERNIKWE